MGMRGEESALQQEQLWMTKTPRPAATSERFLWTFPAPLFLWGLPSPGLTSGRKPVFLSLIFSYQIPEEKLAWCWDHAQITQMELSLGKDLQDQAELWTHHHLVNQPRALSVTSSHSLDTSRDGDNSKSFLGMSPFPRNTGWGSSGIVYSQKRWRKDCRWIAEKTDTDAVTATQTEPCGQGINQGYPNPPIHHPCAFTVSPKSLWKVLVLWPQERKHLNFTCRDFTSPVFFFFFNPLSAQQSWSPNIFEDLLKEILSLAGFLLDLYLHWHYLFQIFPQLLRQKKPLSDQVSLPASLRHPGPQAAVAELDQTLKPSAVIKHSTEGIWAVIKPITEGITSQWFQAFKFSCVS